MTAKIDWTGRIRNLIIDEINKRGKKKFASTRAVYYWLGSINEIPLLPRYYKQVNALTVDMRLKKEIPWGYFPVLRGANGKSASTWISPEDFYNSYKSWFLRSSDYYEMPRWLDQPYHVEVWVEKLGLLPDIERATEGLDVQCRSLSGFPPWEFVYSNVSDIKKYLEDRQENAEFIVLYLGDLDPSGRDIPRQLNEALSYFGINATLRWVALMPEHIKKYNIPEMPTDNEVLAKIHRDPRYNGYMEWLADYGIHHEMFAELDAVNAINPDIISNELRPVIEEYYDESLLEEVQQEYENDKMKLENMLAEAKRKLSR